jgi:hypothetical protein
MRITIGGSEVFSRRYLSFNELMDEYIDHMTERRRRVPEYDESVLAINIASWLLSVFGERLINEFIDELKRGNEEEEARKARELEETRHSELMAEMEESRREIEELRRAVQERETPPDAASALAEEDAAAASALLQLAKKGNLRIDIVLETEAEGDLKKAFEALTKDVPGSITAD